jgi:hypothetical protein
VKKEIADIIGFIGETITKSGIFLGILALVYIGLKRLWFLVAMPAMFLIFLNQLSLILNIQWVDKLTVKGIIVSWLFVLTALKSFWTFFFERK